MPGDQQAGAFSIMSAHRSTSTLGVITMAAVRTEGTEKMRRAVLRITGEVDRYYGSGHVLAVESIRQLLSRLSHRISDVEKDRVFQVVQVVRTEWWWGWWRWWW